MAGLLTRATEPLPRGVVAIGMPIAGVVLTLFFVYLGFPYERLAMQLATQLEAATDVRVDFADIGPHVGLLGPGLEAHGVVATPLARAPVRFDRVRLRPAWSISWFRGEPSVYVDAEGASGSISGAVTVGGQPGFDGVLRGVDLGALPLGDLGGGHIDGTVDVEAYLVLEPDGPYGTLLVDARAGSVLIPNSPVAIPFETLSGDLRFGGEKYVFVDRLELAGPMLDAKIEGSIGHARGRNPSQAPLDLLIQLEVRGAGARRALQAVGVRLSRSGTGTVRLTGPLGNPRIR